MKLKALVDKVTLDCILHPDTELMKKVRAKSRGKLDAKAGIPLLRQVAVTQLYSAMMSYLAREEPSAYERMRRDIEENGGDAEINVSSLERLVPLMRPVNHILGIYKPTKPVSEKEELELEVKLMFEGRQAYESKTRFSLPSNLLEKMAENYR